MCDSALLLYKKDIEYDGLYFLKFYDFKYLIRTLLPLDIFKNKKQENNFGEENIVPF